LLAREHLARTLESVRELPALQREALSLRAVAGLSHEEIGAATGTSAARAKHLVFRARAALIAAAPARDEDCPVIRTLPGARPRAGAARRQAERALRRGDLGARAGRGLAERGPGRGDGASCRFRAPAHGRLPGRAVHAPFARALRRRGPRVRRALPAGAHVH